MVGIGKAGGNVIGQLRARDRSADTEHIPMHALLLDSELGLLDPDIARAAARKAIPELLSDLGSPRFVVLAASLDEPAGAGGAPVVAEMLRGEGIDVVAVVQGEDSTPGAALALRCLSEHVGSVILVTPPVDEQGCTTALAPSTTRWSWPASVQPRRVC